MKRKYNNRKVTTPDGIMHDSKKEANRWMELRLLEKAGEIQALKRQVKFLLIPAQYETYERYSSKTGKRLKDGQRLVEREVSYIADFAYYQNGAMVVEDVKGMRTKEYIIKRKLMLQLWGIKILEV